MNILLCSPIKHCHMLKSALYRTSFFVIDSKYNKLPLAELLQNKYTGLSNSQIQQYVESEKIYIQHTDGTKEFNCQSRVHPGDKVFYPRIIEQINSNTRKEQAKESKKSEKSVDIKKYLTKNGVHIQGRNYPLTTLYEDDNLLIINKPAGIASQGGKNNEINIISIYKYLTHNPHLKLVHRLDKNVSGVLLLCKSQKKEDYLELFDLFKQNQIHKQYLACVYSQDHYQNGFQNTIHQPIFDKRSREMKPSKTSFQVLSSLQSFYLLNIQLHTGRKNQIRSHLGGSLHAPIYKDAAFYPSELEPLNINFNSIIRRYHLNPQIGFEINLYNGIYLTCYRLQFTYKQQTFDIQAPLSTPFQQMVDIFRSNDPQNLIDSVLK